MKDLHPDVAHTAKEMVIKENEGFRIRLEKWESINPKGLFNIDIIQESLDEDGDIWQTSTYNFHMTKEELQSLADGLVA